MKNRFTLSLVALTGVLAVASGVCGSLPAHAAARTQTVTWTGDGDGNSWGDAGNWDGGVPQNGDSVVIAPTAGTSQPSVSGMPAGSAFEDFSITDASLSGGDATVSGTFSWTASHSETLYLDAAITAESSASISGPATMQVQEPLVFDGATNVSNTDGLILIDDLGAAITNSGRFTMEPGSMVEALTCCVMQSKFLNTGTLAVPVSSGGTATMAAMNLDDRGAVSVGKGSRLEVTAGPVELTAGQGVSGAGTLAFDQSASIALASNFSIGSGATVLLADSAEFTGTGSFTGAGRFSWTGGTIEGNLSVAATITTSISGTSQKELTEPGSKPVKLTLAGPTTLANAAAVVLIGLVTLQNRGTFTMRSGAAIGAESCCLNPAKVINAGTVDVTAGTGTAAVSSVAFSNTGTVQVTSGTLSVSGLGYDQTAGTTKLAGGSLSSSQTFQIDGGTLTGYGSIDGSVVSGGTVKPSTTGGVLTISGSYQQNKSGVLSSTITGTSPGTTFGQLAVGQAATLAGALAVSAGGGFAPKPAEAFEILKYQSHTGRFTTKSGTPPYTVTYQMAGAKVVYPA
jgi:hypothetical protein